MWYWYVLAFVGGMLVMALVIGMFTSDADGDSNEYVNALKFALKKSNAVAKLLKKDADDSVDLANRAVMAYKILADDYEYLEMCREKLEERLIIAEVLSEFE